MTRIEMNLKRLLPRGEPPCFKELINYMDKLYGFEGGDDDD